MKEIKGKLILVRVSVRFELAQGLSYRESPVVKSRVKDSYLTMCFCYNVLSS